MPLKAPGAGGEGGTAPRFLGGQHNPPERFSKVTKRAFPFLFLFPALLSQAVSSL